MYSAEGECFSMICTHRQHVSSEVNTSLCSQTLDDSEHVASDNNEDGESRDNDTCVFRLIALTHKADHSCRTFLDPGRAAARVASSFRLLCVGLSNG